MKSLAEQMHNFDREQMRRVAYNLPEQYDEKPQLEQVAQVINSVFSQLLAAFPATTANRDQTEMNEIRRQWVLAFRENGITTMEQVSAGMRVARRQERPFLPSPGQFVAWCKAEEAAAAGLPNADQLVDMIYQYCRTRGQYPDAESYPGSPARTTGWLHPCTRTCAQTASATLSCAAKHQRNWRAWLTELTQERRFLSPLSNFLSLVVSRYHACRGWPGWLKFARSTD